MSADYATLLGEIKERIRTERVRVVLAANEAMVLLYWDIGKAILARQEREGWGAGTIDRLSHDLREAFPDMRGFSPRNLKYMRAFAATWRERKIVQEVLAQITWYHNIALLEKVDDERVRLWYAAKAREAGWSRNVLAVQIENRQHERQGNAVTNFPRTLPPSDSDLATQAFKDPYLFDFLGTAEPRTERELEQGLVDHIQRFLLEMGVGFAFVGRLVQQTTAEYLEERLGWHSVYAYNTETFAPDGALGRTNEEEVVLTRYLRPALDSPNPGLPGEAVDNAIRAIVQVSDPGPERGGQPDAGTPRRKPSASSSSGASKQRTPFSDRGWISGHANSASEPPLTRCWLGRRLLDAHALGN